MTKVSRAREALRGGFERLSALSYRGEWQGFPTLAGLSTTWVTGFVAAHLAATGNYPYDQRLTACALLASQSTEGGWRYGPHVPVDADSTAWCLIALKSMNAAGPSQIQGSRSILLAHFGQDGVSTYSAGSGIARFIGAPSVSMLGGWTSAHTEVTLAALLAEVAPSERSALELIKAICAEANRAGFVESYWWHSVWYATALLLRVLTARGDSLTPETTHQILKVLKSRELAAGGYSLTAQSPLDPFETALALEVACRLPDRAADEIVRRSATALMDAQRPHGGWRGGYPLRIPAPSVVEPSSVDVWLRGTRGGNSLVPDSDGVFATVLACHALARWLINERSYTRRNKSAPGDK